MPRKPAPPPYIAAGLHDLAVDIGSLHPLEGNPRRGDVEAVARSLSRFGQRKPIVVRASDRCITAGNHTFQAAKALGWTQIAALLVDDDEATAHAFALADNRTADLGHYDDEELLALIRSVGEADPTLLIDSGWDEESIVDLIDKLSVLEDDRDVDDAPPRPAEAFSEPGNVWVLGPHRVICGNAILTSDVDAVLGDGQRADMIWMDPPYNVDVEGTAGKITNDDLSDEQFAEFLRGLMTSAHAALKPGGAIYVAHADSQRLTFTRAFVDAGFKLSSCLIWRKSSFTIGRSDYQWQHEPILYGWKRGAAHRWYGDRKKSTIVELDGADVEQLEDGTWRVTIADTTLIISGSDVEVQHIPVSVLEADKPARSKYHPTMKPVALVERMIRNSSKGGGVVLDLCGGSGSTLIAAENSKRKARLVELDPRYVDVICQRYQSYTGTLPVLESTGEPRDFLVGDRD